MVDRAEIKRGRPLANRKPPPKACMLAASAIAAAVSAPAHAQQTLSSDELAYAQHLVSACTVCHAASSGADDATYAGIPDITGRPWRDLIELMDEKRRTAGSSLRDTLATYDDAQLELIARYLEGAGE